MKHTLARIVASGLSVAGAMVAASPAGATTPGADGSLVFAADLGPGFQLFTMQPSGTGLHQLTDAPGAYAPDWSPDGSRVAFERTFSTDGGAREHTRLMVINADGTHQRRLTTKGLKADPAFTPDGHHLVYACNDCVPQGIFVMRTDGTHRRRLSANPFPAEGDNDPNVSPDGRTVTFVRHKVDGELQALYAVDIDGTHERQLVPYFREVAVKHDWAPDGRHIVITTAADYPDGRSPDLATVRPDGSDLRFLTHYRGGARGAFAGSYSPDGRWIVFRVEDLQQDRYALYKIHPDGTGKTLVATLPFRPRGTDWGATPG